MSNQNYYHGSMKHLPVGTILKPQGEEYEANWGKTDFYYILEYYRPKNYLAHKNAVFLCLDVEDVDLAGGGTEYMFEVIPKGKTSQHDLNWSSTISCLISEGFKFDDPEIKEAALSYWQGKPHIDESVWEVLTEEAEIIRVDLFENFINNKILPSM